MEVGVSRLFLSVEMFIHRRYNCDGQAVGWIHDSVLSLREVGLDYLPKDIKRPSKEDKIQELVIPLDYANADWLPKAVQDTADIRKRQR